MMKSKNLWRERGRKREREREREREGGREREEDTSLLYYRIDYITSARELSVFSPPDRFDIFFQLLRGGLTLNTIPSENGSKLSTSSNSASPPSVIIC